MPNYMDENFINQPPIPPYTPNWKENKPRKTRSFLFYLSIVILLLTFAGCALVKHYTFDKWSKNITTYDQVTLKPKKASFFQAVKNFFFQPENILQGQQIDRVNILLLGIGGPGHDGPYLSDTNIIVSLKPTTNQVAMISIPRDMSANIEGYGWGKINHANAIGENNKPGQGGEFARQTFAKNLGVEIPYYVRIDFAAFTEIIDTVGGVEIDAPNSFTDYSYPGSNYSYQTVSFEKGKQTMTGEKALIYARSRHGTNGEASDFARAKRQQLVISALKEKMLSAGTYLNPVKIEKITNSLSTHIATNLDFNQIMYLAGLAKDIDSNNTKTLVLDNSPQGFLTSLIGQDGAYLLSPVTGNYDQIKNAINNIFISTSTQSTALAQNSPSVSYNSAKVEIQNGTWQEGLASRTKIHLEEKGFNAPTIGNCDKRPVTTTAIYLINKKTKKEIAEALAKELKVSQIISGFPATSTKYNSSTDILVVLGADRKE
jgi:LCP family protein required for cell wall assembly